MTTFTFFDKDLSLEEGKKLYRDLLKVNHPDVGGNEETCKMVVKEFELFCSYKMQEAFNQAGDKTGDANVNVFSDMLNKVVNFNCKIEIIGYWIYAFESFSYKEELKALGFFFSNKYKAWIYSGSVKKIVRTNCTLEGNRRVYGSQVIREKDTIKQLEG